MKLIFPIRKLAETGAAPNGPEEKPTPLHILCIDDEPLLRELLREILERDGHTVSLADGGQKGVEEFHAAARNGQPFDVVLTDLGMPYFDGRQVVKAIKQDSPGTPVIMLTGWGSFMKEDGDMPDQISGILSKPPRSAEIREMLRRVCEGNAGPEASPSTDTETKALSLFLNQPDATAHVDSVATVTR